MQADPKIAPIIKATNIMQFKEEYQDAYQIFTDSIFFDKLVTSIQPRRLSKISKGFFVLDELNKENISISSLDIEFIKILEEFLLKLGMIYEPKIERIFSPEEILLDTYTTYVSAIQETILEQKIFRNLISKAISEYDDQNYPISVGTIGIMCEDILIQIYETLFREEADKSLTLGQRYDNIIEKIKKLFPEEEKIKKMDTNLLFNEINNLINEVGTSENDHIQKNTLELVRKITQIIKDQNLNTEEMIKKAFHREANFSLFPKKIQSNFYELLRYRNATSHKSRIPIGSYEAQRSIYCAITIILWWNEKKGNICWTKSIDEIIEEIIQASKES
jgi:hypothetical protein